MKALLLYVVLVGVPIAGVFGIVWLGRDLKPPISVGGAWSMELGNRPVDALPCNAFASSKSLTLNVSQSGPYLVLSLNDQNATRLSGEANGASITAASPEQMTTGSPGAANAIQLQANIDRQPGQDRLQGTLTVANCPGSGQFLFTAIRQPKARGGDY